MKIALIWPKGFDSTYVIPLALGYLQSNLPSHYEVKLFDCSFHSIDADSDAFRKLIEDYNPQVVGVSCWSETYLESVRIFKVIKSINQEITTVIGGAHPTCYPDKTLLDNESIDFLLMGEAELSFPIFIEELKNATFNWSRVHGLVYRSLSLAVPRDLLADLMADGSDPYNAAVAALAGHHQHDCYPGLCCRRLAVGGILRAGFALYGGRWLLV